MAYDSNKDGLTQDDDCNKIGDALESRAGKIHVFMTKRSGKPYPTDPTKFIRAITGGDKPKNTFLLLDTIISARGAVDLVEAHEMGHALGLTARNPDRGGHDPGPFPEKTGLMESGSPDSTTHEEPANPGRWLPHEDWKASKYRSQGL